MASKILVIREENHLMNNITPIQTLHEEVEQHRDTLIQFLREICAIPSMGSQHGQHIWLSWQWANDHRLRQPHRHYRHRQP